METTLKSLHKTCGLSKKFKKTRRNRDIVFDIQQLPNSKLQKRVLKPKKNIVDYDAGETYL